MIKYKIQGKEYNLRGKKEILYHAQILHGGELDLEKLARRVAKQSALTEADCLSALRSFTEIVAETLTDGYIVDMGDFGRFRSSLIGKSVKKIEDFAPSHIKKVRVIFTPGKMIKNALAEVGVNLNTDMTALESLRKPKGKDSLEEQPS